jgi:hypothetical protein
MRGSRLTTGTRSAAIEEEWIRAQQACDGYDGTF